MFAIENVKTLVFPSIYNLKCLQKELRTFYIKIIKIYSRNNVLFLKNLVPNLTKFVYIQLFFGCTRNAYRNK